MNFKNLRDIGNSEPKAWNASVGTRFNTEEDEDDEIPVPYCDTDDESLIESDEDVIIEDTETETECESINSISTKRIKRGVVAAVCVVLQEELDFRDE